MEGIRKVKRWEALDHHNKEQHGPTPPETQYCVTHDDGYLSGWEDAIESSKKETNFLLHEIRAHKNVRIAQLEAVLGSVIAWKENFAGSISSDTVTGQALLTLDTILSGSGDSIENDELYSKGERGTD